MPASYRAARESPVGDRRSARTSGGWPSSASAAGRGRGCRRGAPGGERERAGERLAAVGERGRDELAQIGLGRRPRALQPDEHRVDVRHRREHRARHAAAGPARRRRAGRAPTAGRTRSCRARRRTARRPPSGPCRPSAARRRAPRSCAGSRPPRCRRAGWRRPSSAPARAPRRSSFIASAKCSVTLSNGSTASRRAASSARSSSTTCTCATRGARYSESTPRPPPISSTTSSGPSRASRSMTPRMFESMRKFWPRSRLGRTPKSRIRRRLGCVVVRAPAPSASGASPGDGRAGSAAAHHRSSAAALRSTSCSSSS